MRGGRFPDDQAESVFSDAFVEQLGSLSDDERLSVIAEVVRLCDDPAGKHPLHTPLAGWNTLDVLGGHRRVVYKASAPGDVGLVEVLCLGPRSDNEVYDMAVGLRDAGLLEPDEITDLWDALAVLDVIEEDVGLDGWDFRPPLPPEGMVRAAVAAGLLDGETASLLSQDELEAAMADGWGPAGADPVRAIIAALERARRRRRVEPIDRAAILSGRRADRCEAVMPRAGTRCIRRRGHPGPHRSR
ncbi:MAG: hypothetical protein JJE52_11005 [Acidimicrobiia bacterium]|nr:hypothetical protein [Acidimicrobiia bacterium]